MPSTIPAVKGALLSILSDALTGVLVTWGVPRGTKPAEWVLIGNVTGAQRAAAIGRGRRAETYTVEIQVTVVNSDTVSQQETTERAYAIVEEIEDAIRADETLGNLTGLIWARVEATPLTEGVRVNPDGSTTGERMAEVMVGVGCESRI